MMATGVWQHREPVLSINIADVLPANVDGKGEATYGAVCTGAGSVTSHHVKYHERRLRYKLKKIRMPASKRHR